MTAKTAKRATTATTTATATKIGMRSIPLDRIRRNPQQPRQHFDQTKLQELAESMKELGQLQAITVRYVPATRDYELIAGERRWRAAKIAGLGEMYALVFHGIDSDDDAEAFGMAVAENCGRVDMTPLEEGRSFALLIGKGYAPERVAGVVGKSLAYVNTRVELLKLAPEVQEAVDKGHVNVGLASELTRLSPDLQVQILTRWLRGEYRSGRDAIAYARTCAEVATSDAHGGGLFLVEERTEEEKRVIREKRTRVVSRFDQLGKAGAILQELMDTDPEDLADVLAGAEGGIAAYQARIEQLRSIAWKANAKLREAAAIAQMRAGAVEVNPDAAVDAEPAAATA